MAGNDICVCGREGHRKGVRERHTHSGGVGKAAVVAGVVTQKDLAIAVQSHALLKLGCGLRLGRGTAR
jgi:hypothetical protein